MSRIVVFGAGGRAGRTAVAEALRRGHTVTAVVRDPASHQDLAELDAAGTSGPGGTAGSDTDTGADTGAGAGAAAGGGLSVVAGDVLDAASVAKAAAGTDAAIVAAADLSIPARDFFGRAARAVGTGLAEAGVRRVVYVGIASLLPGKDGVALLDDPGFPAEHREFSLGHAAGLEALRETSLDWLYISPAGDFDHDGERAGSYRLTDHGDWESRLSYPDFAIALLDEIDEPAHRGVHLAITS
ncbi:NAD(P)H-binding protein [Spirillospora sp. NPDC047279]|uniref:NAD(P)-dependent oxidoreductase n=1 Tax=Spirillospora sp. NPDC047279 TaxID=3155478 RepID=UPI0033E57E0A